MTASATYRFTPISTGSSAALRIPEFMRSATRAASNNSPTRFYFDRQTSGLLRSSIEITNSSVMTEPEVAISPVTSALSVVSAAGFVGGCVWAIVQPNSAAGLVAAASIFILVFIGKSHKKKLDETRQHHH